MPRGRGERKIFGIGLGALSLGAVASAAAGGYKIAEFLVHAKKLKEVTSENKVFVRLVERVQLDLAEVDRLLKLPAIKHSLRRNPKKVAWIKNTVTAMDMALEQLASYSGTVANDTRGGRHAGLWTRMKWVLDEHEKLVHRQMEVNLSHQGIVAVLQFLGALEPMNCCEEEPVTGLLPYGMQREDVYGGFASQARAMAQIEDEPVGETVDFRERDVYEREEPIRETVKVREENIYEQGEPRRETIRVREKDVYEREEPVRETVRVREENIYERGEPRRDTVRVREKEVYGREPFRENVQIREQGIYGRDKPVRRRVEVKEKTEYGWDEPMRESINVKERMTYGRDGRDGPIRMQDNETVSHIPHAQSTQDLV
jgi:hypothetical protein